jgi:hypothetical protein
VVEGQGEAYTSTWQKLKTDAEPLDAGKEI